MLVVVAGAASRNDGGARARGARSLGARRRGVSEGGSGLLGWAAALVVGLLVVSVAVVLGELALTLVGVPVSAAVPVTLFQSAGPLEQPAGAACPSEDGGGGSAGSAGGCGQRVVGSGVSDGRRRLSMLLAAACGGGRGSRESCRGSQRSPGGRPLVCAMCVSPLPMSCAHVRRCLIYLWTSNSYCGRISYVESRCTRCCRSSTNVHPIALLSIL